MKKQTGLLLTALIGIVAVALADDGPIIDGLHACSPPGQPELEFDCPEGSFCCSMPVYGSPPYTQVTQYATACCTNGSNCKAQRQGTVFVTFCTSQNPGGGD